MAVWQMMIWSLAPPAGAQEIATLLPAVSSAMYVRHYAHHVYLFATVWKQLPAIAAAVGKVCAPYGPWCG
jgi:hypothetical protein